MDNWFVSQLPVVQGAVRGGVTTPALVASVANAGGLGVLEATELTAAQITAAINQIRERTADAFAVHLVVPQPFEASLDQMLIVKQVLQPYFQTYNLDVPVLKEPYIPSFAEQMEAIIAAKVPVFYFSCGIPALSWIDRLKAAGIYILGTATHQGEAIILKKVGVDAIVAQGIEACGDRSTFMGDVIDASYSRDVLLKQITESVNLPVIACGGIGNSTTITHCLQLGAAAVMMHSIFIVSKESGASDTYKKKLMEVDQKTIIFSNAITGRPTQVIRNAFIDDMAQYKPFMLPYPLQALMTQPLLSHDLALWTERDVYALENQAVADKLVSLFTERYLAL